MQNDDQYEGANQDLLGGIEDVDNSMMETMYNLSAYVSGSNNDEDDNVESDDDASGQCEVSISIDGIDNRLLDRAREEVPAVLLNLKKRIGSRRDRDVRTISPGDCLKAFMDPNFLGYMKAYINANMKNSNDLVSSSDIIAFIRVELMISFYKVSPSMYFDPANASNFPSSTGGMSLYRYSQILKALDTTNRAPRTQVVCGTTGLTVDSLGVGVWKPPMTHNTDMATDCV
ncbi:hypothetical protein MHU86_11245 [Fragilaria crotonensis]|nr:hypothetical protein MHU86_11245 [Fragilaria crotonensis]